MLIGPGTMQRRMPATAWSTAQTLLMAELLRQLTEQAEEACRGGTITPQQRDEVVSAYRVGMATMAKPIFRVALAGMVSSMPYLGVQVDGRALRPVDRRMM